MDDTRDKRDEREKLTKAYVKSIKSLYNLKTLKYDIEVWTKDDATNPLPSQAMIRVTMIMD